jgi:hypothetical protein
MFNFPDPNSQNTFSLGEKTWKWNGSYWEIVKQIVVSDGIKYYQQDDAPSGVNLGDRWLNTQNLTEYVYVQLQSDPDEFGWMDLTGDYPGEAFLGG